jgi:hypothetical protein
MTPSPAPTPLQIFLCHSSADKPAVRTLHHRLLSSHFSPWLDEQSIPPGADWDREIRLAVQSSAIFLVCLSRSSITKEGYLQKEIRLALDHALTKPDGAVYIIPVRLEQCEIPESLSKYQWVDLFVLNGYERLLTALENRRAQLAAHPSQNSPSQPPPPAHYAPTHQQTSPWPYAIIAGIAFLAALAVIELLLRNAQTLTALGLTGNLYYVALIPLALCAALVLFGVLRSYAAFRGEHFGGVVTLGGPIVAAALVIIGGFTLVPNPLPFSITCYVHGHAGPQDIVLRNQGAVVLDLAGDRRSVPIGPNGQAFFPGIPANFRNQTVYLSVESPEYESTTSKPHKLRDTMYLEVKKRPGKLFGRVTDEDGQPLANVDLTVVGLTAKTTESGAFKFQIPGERMAPELDLTATAPNFEPFRTTAYPNSNAIDVVLKRSAKPH